MSGALNNNYAPEFHRMQIYIACVFFIIFLAVIASIISSNWFWFSRAGSLIVIVGIHMTFYDIEESLKELRISMLDETLDNLKAEDNDIFKEEKYTRVKKIIYSRLEFLMGKIFRFVEMIVLIIGTLVWGYGDLIGCLYCAKSCT